MTKIVADSNWQISVGLIISVFSTLINSNNYVLFAILNYQMTLILGIYLAKG